jgi:hypothetical protein
MSVVKRIFNNLVLNTAEIEGVLTLGDIPDLSAKITTDRNHASSELSIALADINNRMTMGVYWKSPVSTIQELVDLNINVIGEVRFVTSMSDAFMYVGLGQGEDLSAVNIGLTTKFIRFIDSKEALLSIKVVTDALTSEVSRATSTELSLTSSVSTELYRATAAEQSLTSSLSSEVSRATSNELSLTSSVSTELYRATAAEQSLTSSLSSEVSRASSSEKYVADTLFAVTSSADQLLYTSLSSEVVRATAAEQSLTSSLSSEVSRATSNEQSLTSSVSTELYRATAAEQSLTSSLSSEVSRASSSEKYVADTLFAVTSSADQLLYTSLSSEVVRAISNEQSLTSSLSSEVSRATSNEQLLTTSLSSEVSRATSSELAINTQLDGQVKLYITTTSLQVTSTTITTYYSTYLEDNWNSSNIATGRVVYVFINNNTNNSKNMTFDSGTVSVAKGDNLYKFIRRPGTTAVWVHA